LKVIIHAGCAKNGSTAFQTMMARAGPGLATHGLYYPKAPVGHRHLAERAYLDDYRWVGEVMQTARAAVAGCVLLSTEHFQNLLCQKAYALGLASAFREAGAGDVRFVFSVRAPFDYFQSIYAEAAKWFPISYEQSAHAALHQGMFWTAWQGMVPVAYVFDYALAFGDLRRFLATAGSGVGLDCWELSDFAQGFAGRRLLAEAGVPDAALDEIEAGLTSSQIAIDRNIRRDPNSVELLHAQQFLFGDTVLPAQKGSEEFAALVDLTARVANRRLIEMDRKREAIRARFAERFADWRKCLSPACGSSDVPPIADVSAKAGAR
jgi:hypothetical protein